MRASLGWVTIAAVLAGCSGGEERPNATSETGIATAVNNSATDGESGVESGTESGTSGDASDSAMSGTDTNDSSSIKFDAGAEPTTGEIGCINGEGPDCLGCTAVDLLFIVDNSVSMTEEQIALGQAFPNFADTVLDALPEDVNLHVAVTSTEMGYTPQGSYDPDAADFCLGPLGGTSEGSCNDDSDCPDGTICGYALVGSGGECRRPPEYFYQTPDTDPSATNGAQGRLYVADGLPYFEIDTSAPQNERDALKDWFTSAATIGNDGSQVEMPMAGAAWAMDTAVNTGNVGFVRDEGAVLVLFFITDEPDQTPTAETQTLLNKIAAAKSGCGGWDCVVGGGFVIPACNGSTAIGDLFDELPDPPVLSEFTQGVPPSPEDFDPVLAGTLATVIVEKCGEIKPPG